MTTRRKHFETIDEYVRTFPKEVRAILQEMRRTTQRAAPDAVEAISYQMPTFKLNGKNLVHFAGYENHIGCYPIPSGIAAFEKELAPYRKGKGSVQFPLDEPVPFGLVAKIVRFRLKESSKRRK